MSFKGFVPLNSALAASIVIKNSSSTPLNADAAPTYRVYGPNGVMANGTGTLALKDTGSVSTASNTSPVVITTTAPHGLTNGTRVTIAGVTGSTTANGTFTVQNAGASTFELAGTSAGGAGTGGTWNATGVYNLTVTPTAANNYVQGATYHVLVTAYLSGVPWADMATFTVV